MNLVVNGALRMSYFYAVAHRGSDGRLSIQRQNAFLLVCKLLLAGQFVSKYEAQRGTRAQQ